MSFSGMIPPTMTSTSSRPDVGQELDDPGDQGQVGAGEEGEPDRVGILLHHRLDHLLGGLVEAGVDHLEAAVAQGAGDDLGPPVVAVEPGLGDDHPVGTLHEASMIGTPLAGTPDRVRTGAGAAAWPRAAGSSSPPTRSRPWPGPANPPPWRRAPRPGPSGRAPPGRRPPDPAPRPRCWPGAGGPGGERAAGQERARADVARAVAGPTASPDRSPSGGRRSRGCGSRRVVTSPTSLTSSVGTSPRKRLGMFCCVRPKMVRDQAWDKLRWRRARVMPT